MRTAAAAGTGARLLLLLGLLASRPSAPRAQIVTLQSPTTEAPSLADQFRLYRWGPEVPPHEWKCWGMGNGARDWRNGDLEGCHMFTAHEANFKGDDIRTLTAAILANGTEITYVDLAGADIAAAAEVTDRAEALRDLLGSPLSLEEMNLEKNGFYTFCACFRVAPFLSILLQWLRPQEYMARRESWKLAAAAWA